MNDEKPNAKSGFSSMIRGSKQAVLSGFVILLRFAAVVALGIIAVRVLRGHSLPLSGALLGGMGLLVLAAEFLRSRPALQDRVRSIAGLILTAITIREVYLEAQDTGFSIPLLVGLVLMLVLLGAPSVVFVAGRGRERVQ